MKDTTRPVAVDQASFSERAHRVIPGGSHTYSRGDDQFPSLAPAAFARAKGARIWDVGGREFVDWGMGINNVLIGHAEDAIDDAAVDALRNGQAFSRPTPLEVALAEEMVAVLPGMDMVKFGKNGSDANTAAIRLARAVTGRDLVAFDGTAPFLSIHDWFIGKTAMAAGVPGAVRELSVTFTFGDLASVEAMFAEHPRRIAAVILEVCRDQRPPAGFLEGLRRLCDADGALLIFDEVVTGFRYGWPALYATLGVTPDLLSLGKGMANGYALSALAGRRDYMERGGLQHPHDRVFLLSTTNGPEQSALAAALRTVRFYQEEDVIGALARNGGAAAAAVQAAAARHGIGERVSTYGDYASRPFLKLLGPDGAPSMPFRTLFLQEVLRRGIFMPWICPSFRHGASEIARTAEALDGACEVYARALNAGSVDGLLTGPAVKPVFRRKN